MLTMDTRNVTVGYMEDSPMSHSLKMLEAMRIEAKKQFELVEEAYDAANIAASPFKVGARIVYQGSEYQIDRVNSMTHCATSCLAFPIKKDGTVSVRNSVGIYSDLSSFKIIDAKETEQEHRSAVAAALTAGRF